MKKITLTICLLVVIFYLLSSTAGAQDLKTAQWQLAYKRSSLHLLDKQASPLIYESNLNGLMLRYAHAGIKSRSFVQLHASTGTALPKGFGVREFTFTDTDFEGTTKTTGFFHAPTVYLGQLEVGYLRKLRTRGKKAIFVGSTFQNWMGYSDNIGMWSTWATNIASLNAAILYERQFTYQQSIQLQATFPVLGIVSRMPYTNNISSPGKSNARAFFEEGTRFTSLHELQRFTFNANYHYRLSRHLQVGASYDFFWLHDTTPRSLKTYSHSFGLQTSYLF